MSTSIDVLFNGTKRADEDYDRLQAVVAVENVERIDDEIKILALGLRIIESLEGSELVTDYVDAVPILMMNCTSFLLVEGMSLAIFTFRFIGTSVLRY